MFLCVFLGLFAVVCFWFCFFFKGGEKGHEVGWRDREDLGGDGGGKRVIRIYCKKKIQ